VALAKPKELSTFNVFPPPPYFSRVLPRCDISATGINDRILKGYNHFSFNVY